MFLIPKNEYPNKLIFKYAYCKNSFVPSHKDLLKKYAKSNYPERGLQFEDFEKALIKASTHLRNYRGKA